MKEKFNKSGLDLFTIVVMVVVILAALSMVVGMWMAVYMHSEAGVIIATAGMISPMFLLFFIEPIERGK